MNHIHEQIEELGFAQICLGNFESALEVASLLGGVIHQTEVRVRPNAATYLSSQEKIPPHTDHPDAKFILWYCHLNDEVDGANLLIDGRKVVESMSVNEQRSLAQIKLKCPDRLSLQSKGLHPFWQPRSRSIFYAPWLRIPDIDQPSLDIFESQLNSFGDYGYKVTLKPGDGLVIDNHRMLHYRNKLDANSLRWLTRLWITAVTPVKSFSNYGAIRSNKLCTDKV